MGITEPAIFGVSLRCFKPFIGGALYASIVGPGAAGTVARGLELVYTGKDSPCVPRFTDASMADGRTAPRPAYGDRRSCFSPLNSIPFGDRLIIILEVLYARQHPVFHWRSTH